MPANTTPIFPLTPKVSWGKITSSNESREGTGSTVLLFTAGAEGSRIDQISVEPLGNNIQTVLRLFVNNGSTPATADNNALIHELTLGVSTGSQTVSGIAYDVTIEKDGGATTVPPIPYLSAGYKIYGSVGAGITAGIIVVIHGGDY